MEDTESIRALVCQRIEEVENAMKSLQCLRKTLLHKAYEAKQSILNTFISQRNSMQSQEMNLLIEVDKLLHSKDDALVTQLSKLSQVLGCLRNCLQSAHPCGDCLEKYEDIDMMSVDEVSLEFSAANEMLTESVRNYRQPMGVSTSTMDDHRALSTTKADNMTKWLLTPSNNHQIDEAQQQDFTSTEWLLERHADTSTGIGTADMFSSVKRERKDEWLNKSMPLASSLSFYVFTLFDRVAADDDQHWLHQESCSRKNSMSDNSTVSSDATSSVDSSCVIISSSTSSESELSFSLLDRSWVKPPAPLSTSPHKVSEWVASCHSAAVEECPDRSRERLLSLCSNSSNVIEPISQPAGEWLSHNTPQYRETQVENGFNQPESWLHSTHADVWPADGDSDRLNRVSTEINWLLPTSDSNKVKLGNWLEEKTEPSSEKFSADETWLFKTSPKSDQVQAVLQKQTLAWLVESGVGSKHGSSDVDEWLAGEEKVDEPERMSMASRSDESWLLIKDELSRISGSIQSEWILGSRKTSASVISVPDNRLFVADS